jgi:hypothetical protein
MGQTDFDTIGLGGTAVTPTAAQLNLTMQGVAAGYKMARGTSVSTASELVTTGLATVVGFVVAPVGATATVLNLASAASAKAAATAGKLNVYRWVCTSADTPTLIAATTAGTVGWLAIGT